MTGRMPAPVGFVAFIVSGCHTEEFLTGQGVIVEAAQHAAGDQVGAGLVDATVVMQ